MDSLEFSAKRRRLVALVDEAAELEHALCCLYLFSAFSMKLEEDAECTLAQVELLRRWKGQMLTIARQEMEHLAIATNLLTAMGEAPHLRRPDFPTTRRSYSLELRASLLPFSLQSLGTFLLFELPSDSTVERDKLEEFLERPGAPPEDATLLKRLEKANPDNGLEHLYTEVLALIAELGEADEDRLFTGPPDAQVSNTLVFETFPAVPSNSRVYDVLVATVTDTESAIAAVTQIMAEGEGTPSDPETGHFLLVLGDVPGALHRGGERPELRPRPKRRPQPEAARLRRDPGVQAPDHPDDRRPRRRSPSSCTIEPTT